MNMTKKLSGFAAFAGAMLAVADVPTVSNVSMSQAEDRTVTVTYTLANAPAVITMDVETNGPNGWVSIGGEGVCGVYGAHPTGDVWKQIDTDGTHTITWHPDLSWPDHKITGNGARVAVTAWALDNTPDYMAVSLEANALDRIRYYPGAEYVPGGVLGNTAYRTTHLLMRKIMAKGVTYTMGSSEAEVDYNGTKEGFREVDMTNNFYIGVFEVTQSQWANVSGSRWACAFTNEYAMRPVGRLSYADVRGGNQFRYPAAPGGWIGTLNNAVPGMAFDLPSETQWEWACRAGNGLGYWGNGKPIAVEANDTNCPGRYKEGPRSGTDMTPILTSANGNTPPSEGGTAICGSYPPNSWGLYDMHGNVSEHVIDWYSTDTEMLKQYRGAPNADGEYMLNGDAATQRLTRGGCYTYNTKFARSASRHIAPSNPSTRQGYFGFRLICRAGLK